MLKQILFVLTLASFCLAQAKPTTFQHQKKNSIRLHPVNLVALAFDDYAIELDYTRLLNKRFEMVARYSYFSWDPAKFDLDLEKEGHNKEWEIEVGMRYRTQVLTKPNGRIIVYPQLSFSGGDVDYYVYNREDNEVEYDYSGKTARIYLIGGAQFELKRFIFGLDLGLGIGLYIPNERERLKSEPNFTIGYAF